MSNQLQTTWKARALLYQNYYHNIGHELNYRDFIYLAFKYCFSREIDVVWWISLTVFPSSDPQQTAVQHLLDYLYCYVQKVFFN